MKTFLLTVSFLTLLVSISQAQTKTDAKAKKTGNEWHAAGDAPTRSKEFADRLMKSLTLDESTTKKVYAAYLANTKSVDEIKFGSDSEQAKKDALKANQESFDEKLKNILTPTQFSNYMKLEKKN